MDHLQPGISALGSADGAPTFNENGSHMEKAWLVVVVEQEVTKRLQTGYITGKKNDKKFCGKVVDFFCKM